MANTLTAVTPKLLAQGLLALRENCIAPRLVNWAYESMAGQQGSTIDVPIPSAIAAQDVTPAATPPSTADIAPTSVPITLSYWKEAPFYMTDNDILTAMNGTLPMQASEAVKSLANVVDQSILALYTKFYGWQGSTTAGQHPFYDGTANDASQVRKVLNKQLAPLDPRFVIFNPDAEANALNVRAFQDMSFSGSGEAIINGKIERRLGFAWFMDQNVRTHTAGTGSGYLVNNGAGYAAGSKTVVTDTGSGTVLAGDIITFAGHTQTYVVVSSVGGASVTSITFEPGLATTVADNVAITLKASHVANLAFHRDAIAFATRPFANDAAGLGNIVQSALDPVSGLTLRLEISREHKRVRYSFDILWGCEVVRRELGARLAGPTS